MRNNSCQKEAFGMAAKTWNQLAVHGKVFFSGVENFSIKKLEKNLHKKIEGKLCIKIIRKF